MLSLLGPLWLSVSAWAGVTAVPAGTEAVTVMLCTAPGGCPHAAAAMDRHMAELGLPVLDFDAVAEGLPMQAQRRLDRALDALRADPSPAHAEAARRALSQLPATVGADTLFEVLFWSGVHDLEPGGLAPAAAVSGGRTHDLPPLEAAVLARYLDAVDAHAAASPGELRVGSDIAGAQVFVDGRPVGAAPLALAVSPGWHRVSVSRAGRRSAWVGEVVVPEGRAVATLAQIAADDDLGSLESALVGAVRGSVPEPALVAPLARWGAEQGLRRVRFVQLVPEAAAAPTVPEERVHDPDPTRSDWAVLAAWMDVPSGRVRTVGPGPAALQRAADTARFRLGAGLGWQRLGAAHHAALEVRALIRMHDLWAVDLAIGGWRGGTEYYLYQDFVGASLYPVAVGARLGQGAGGPYGALHALAVVPYALGGQAAAGWDFAPGPGVRIQVEGRAGATDKGVLAGAGTSLLFRY